MGNGAIASIVPSIIDFCHRSIDFHCTYIMFHIQAFGLNRDHRMKNFHVLFVATTCLFVATTCLFVATTCLLFICCYNLFRVFASAGPVKLGMRASTALSSSLLVDRPTQPIFLLVYSYMSTYNCTSTNDISGQSASSLPYATYVLGILSDSSDSNILMVHRWTFK